MRFWNPCSPMYEIQRNEPVKLRSSIQGFTLLELMIALGIFALMSTLAYQGLSVAQTSQQAVMAKMDDLKALQMTWQLLQQDLANLVDRPIRDEFGDPHPGLTTEDDGLLSFTRTRNVGVPITRTHDQALVRIGYKIEDQTLIRQIWPALDPAEAITPVDQPLYPSVDNIQIRFLHTDGQWLDHWPPANLGLNDLGKPAMPRAIEIKIESERWGTLVRLFPGIHAFSDASS
ncbi:MAG: type II secretion system protein GspJ [Gammaproteobacteria bacterium]|nr:MAG: type II secretion system protein GspJ [Gammaproteobacteria bacterium]